jgi:hypothetical protein
LQDPPKFTQIWFFGFENKPSGNPVPNRPLLLSSPAALMAMPVKRKRKIDPMILKAREERRKKRIRDRFYKALLRPKSFRTNLYPGANPTIASYNASVVKIYNATNSMARFYNKNYFSMA